MYNSHYEMVYNQAVQGIKIKVVKKEDSLVMTEFELQKGTFLPERWLWKQKSVTIQLLSGRQVA